MNSLNVILLKHIKLQSGSSLIEIIPDQETEKQSLLPQILSNDLLQIFQDVPMGNECQLPTSQACSSFPQKPTLPSWLCTPILRCRLPFHYQGDRLILEVLRSFQIKAWDASFTPSSTLSHKIYGENSIELHYFIEKKDKNILLNSLGMSDSSNTDDIYEHIRETDLLKLIYRNTLLSTESPVPKSLNTSQLNAAQKLINKYHSTASKKSFLSPPSSPLPVPRSSSVSSSSSAEENIINSLSLSGKVEKEKKKRSSTTIDQAKPVVSSAQPALSQAPVKNLASRASTQPPSVDSTPSVPPQNISSEPPVQTSTKLRIKRNSLNTQETLSTAPLNPPPLPTNLPPPQTDANSTGESITPTIINVPLTTRRESIKGKVVANFLKRRTSVSSNSLLDEVKIEKTLIESTSTVLTHLPPPPLTDVNEIQQVVKEKKVRKIEDTLPPQGELQTLQTSSPTPSNSISSSATTSASVSPADSSTTTTPPPIVQPQESNVITISSPLKGVDEVNILEKISDENFEIAYSSKADQVPNASTLKQSSRSEGNKEHETSKVNHYAKLGSAFVVTQSQSLLKRGGRGTPGAGRGSLR